MNPELYLMIGAIVVMIVVLLVFLFVVYNRLVMLRNKVQEAFATMDVCLKKVPQKQPTAIKIN